jgi:hypothetical protein
MKTVDEKPTDTVQINAIMLRSQRELLKSKAAAANMNVSQFLQKLITDATVISKPDLSADIQKTNGWLGRINSNLNMLAKSSNIFKEKTLVDVLLMRLSFIQEEVNEVVKFTSDLRAQGYGKRRKARSGKKPKVTA